MENHFTSLIDQCFNLMFQAKEDVPFNRKKIVVLIALLILTTIIIYFTI